MFGLREAGVLGASVALAGTVGYLVWTYASPAGEKEPETRRGQDGVRARQEAEGEEEPGEEGREAGLTVPVVADEAQKVSQSGPAQSAGTQVLVLGLDGAGKTSLLRCFASGSMQQDVQQDAQQDVQQDAQQDAQQDVQPTEGFNAVSINREDMHVEFLEIGGKEELRPYWQKYMSRALLLVFMVDSSRPELFPVAKRHLHELLAPHPRLPLMVLANKQDLAGVCSITDLHDALSLSEVGDRRLFLIGTHVKKGEAELSSGVQDARDLIIQMVCEGR